MAKITILENKMRLDLKWSAIKEISCGPNGQLTIQSKLKENQFLFSLPGNAFIMDTRDISIVSDVPTEGEIEIIKNYFNIYNN